MVRTIGQCFWMSGPIAVTGIAHMFAVKAGIWKRLAAPIDGGRIWRGRPIFGPNKTWRGVVFMIGVAALLGTLQGGLGGAWADRHNVSPMDLSGWIGESPSMAGYTLGYMGANALFGLGYVLGELPNSFMKRRLEVGAGQLRSGIAAPIFLLADQADSVVAALAIGVPFFGYGWKIFLVGSVSLSALHLLINGSLYLAGARKNL